MGIIVSDIKKIIIEAIELVLVLCFLLLGIDAWATCTGSSPTWTSASCSLSDVSACLSAASAGDTVNVPAGSCTWSSTITISKSLYLIAAGTTQTNIACGAANPCINISLASDVPVRISGFNFDKGTNNGSDNYAVKISGKTDGSFALTQIRIDNNKFNKGKRALYIVGWIYGVADHNQFINCDIAVGLTGDNNYAWSRPIAAGTGNAFFIENNIFTLDTNADYELNEQIYNWDGDRSVTRYNTFNAITYGYNSCLYDSHGNQNYYTGNSTDSRSQPIIEIYNNTFNIGYTYRLIYIRGGSFLIHHNTVTSVRPVVLLMLSEEESWQSSFFIPLATVWPAEDQINNSFMWNNTNNGSTINNISLENVKDLNFINKKRDYFLSAPSASGGKETYPTRPGARNMTFSSSGANAYYPYTPYTYPHPLSTIRPRPPKIF